MSRMMLGEGSWVELTEWSVVVWEKFVGKLVLVWGGVCVCVGEWVTCSVGEKSYKRMPTQCVCVCVFGRSLGRNESRRKTKIKWLKTSGGGGWGE